ncbi:hypothetical protein [Microcystis aeruginosa]|uniref:Transposase n=1 Tax=Microcystis aeruginosa FD4 TaxID=2686288 RepID=A0A857D3Q2_MICAE|nr:hypothetical protein [Microcystis aeruginosa]QGZ90468.1 hypothetical protein GQR42_13915 [Microcystis aeruginosa FD4]
MSSVVLIGLENGFLEETRFLDFKTKKRFADKVYTVISYQLSVTNWNQVVIPLL